MWRILEQRSLILYWNLGVKNEAIFTKEECKEPIPKRILIKEPFLWQNQLAMLFFPMAFVLLGGWGHIISYALLFFFIFL